MNDIIRKGNGLAGLGLAGGLGILDFDFPIMRDFVGDRGFEAWEEGDDLFFAFDVPGFGKEELSVSFEDGFLKIRGETSPKDKRKYLTRRVDRSFERTFSLPEGVDAPKGSAEYKNGVLTIRFPKSESAKPRIINIT